MPGMLTFKELQQAVSAGEIDVEAALRQVRARFDAN